MCSLARFLPGISAASFSHLLYSTPVEIPVEILLRSQTRLDEITSVFSLIKEHPPLPLDPSLTTALTLIQCHLVCD